MLVLFCRFMDGDSLFEVVVCCAQDMFVRENEGKPKKIVNSGNVVIACQMNDPFLVEWALHHNVNDALDRCRHFSPEEIDQLPHPSPLIGLRLHPRLILCDAVVDSAPDIRLRYILCSSKWKTLLDLRSDLAGDMTTYNTWYKPSDLKDILEQLDVDHNVDVLSSELFINLLLNAVGNVCDLQAADTTKRVSKRKNMDV